MPKSVPGVMHEFQRGQLHSGAPKGPVVVDPKQAIAIALSEQKPGGGGMPVRPAPTPAPMRRPLLPPMAAGPGTGPRASLAALKNFHRG